MKNRFAFLTFLVLLFIFLSPYAYAARIKLAWDPPTTNSDGSPLTNPAGYRIYYGAAPGVYEPPIDVPLADVVINNGVATYTLPDLAGGQTYYIAVTTYDTSTPLNESDYSNEVIGGIFVVAIFPPGLEVVVDSVAYTAPETFGWEVGSSHSLSVTSPQPGEIEGTQYVYCCWDDGGDQNHTITASSETPAYIVFFTTQYSLATYVNPVGAGMINPSGTNWYDDGQSVTLSATANAGYTFSGWSGDASGTTGPIEITMDANKTVTANFTVVPGGGGSPPDTPSSQYTVMTSPTGLQITVDGTNYTAPQIFNWSSGSTHTVSVSSPQSGVPGTRYVFSSWSDGGAQDHTITAPSASTTYTVNFTTQYSLTTAVNPTGGGTASPSGTSWYDSGQSVSVSVIAGSEYSFSGWSGDLTGTSSPISLTMNGPKSVTAQMTSIPETISTPAQPSGPPSGSAGTSYSYIASGVSSNLGHSLEYQYDWKGDGIDLSMWGAANQQKAWLVAGQYNVRVRARCSVHTSVLSNWSTGTPVIIQADSRITCTDGGIQCLERTDGGNDGDNLVNGRPRVDGEYQFKIVMQDKGGTPQYVKLFMTQRSDPRESDFYGYDMSCSGDHATGANCTYRTKFGPAPVHKIFFQAKTSGGTIITYPDSGYITGPQIHLLRGYNLVGIPRDINNALFDGQEALGSPEVYRWHADEGYYTEVTTSEPVLAGEGYLVYTHNATLIELADFGEVQAQEYAYPLKPGLNCISNPYSGNVRLSDVKIQKGTQTPVSWQEAASNGWVVDALYYYNGEDWGDTYSHMNAEGGAVLVPWLGYWVDLNSTDDAYFLVTSKP